MLNPASRLRLPRRLTAIGFLFAIATVPPLGAQPEPVVEGYTVDDATLSSHRYTLSDSGVVRIEYLGQLNERPEIVGGEVQLPDSALSSITLSDRELFVIYDRISESSDRSVPGREFGVHLQSESLRIQFDQGLPIWLAALIAGGLIVFGGAAVWLTLTRRERMRMQEEAAARQRALHAREAERTRIAREIHDGPLQDVHALRLLSGTQNDVLGEEAGRIARELRAIAEGLRPPALGRFGLAAALSAHANRVKERYKTVAVALHLDEDDTGPNAIPDIARSALFRIAQESITNAIEHGGASRILVSLDLPEAEGSIVLDIRDNGEGLPWGDAQPDLSALADDGHFGLVGMHERVTAIGGTLVMDSEGLEGGGARVRVTLPDLRRMGLSDPPVRRPRHLVPA